MRIKRGGIGSPIVFSEAITWSFIIGKLSDPKTNSGLRTSIIFERAKLSSSLSCCSPLEK
jgi:hypothetical protein